MATKWVVVMLVVPIVLVLDRVTKAVAVDSWSRTPPIVLIPGFATITYVENPGVAFGLFGSLPDGWRTVLLLAVTVLAVGVIAYALWRQPGETAALPLALALLGAGAVGNLVDRARQGYVVDFVDLYVGDLHWPAFNVADAAITAGAVLLVILLAQAPRHRGR